MPRPPKVIIEPAKGRDGWDIAIEGRRRPVAHTETKAAAEPIARATLGKLGGGELERRRRDGTIQDARTIGRKENRRSPG
jgi:hypothetical protein